ncbi:MAG TPA: hypothetical protein VIH82_08835 [Acidimicrobiia bacterium]|jgi:hypothetical protein
MRRAVVAATALILAVLSGAPVAGAHLRHAPRDLPPADRATLARMFDPDLKPLGLRTTRAALQDTDSYERSETGTHLAIYVEPIAKGEVSRAVYVRNIVKVARIFLPFVYKRWSGLKSFDVCQEPEQVLDPRPAPIPVTQLIADRAAAAAVRWKHATLATLIKQADVINGKKGEADPLSLFVSPRAYAEPEYQDALRDAGVTTPT